jgi:hypothetical protein
MSEQNVAPESWSAGFADREFSCHDLVNVSVRSAERCAVVAL